MSDIFETQLGEQLDTALESRKDEAIVAAVEAIIGAIWRHDADSGDVETVIARLQDDTEFARVVDVADAAIAADLATIPTQRRYSQALIELGALHAAELELKAILANETATPPQIGEARGLLGRLRKQRYLSSKRPADLEAAISSYNNAFSMGTDEEWHGVNLAALMKLAEREGQPLGDDLPRIDELTSRILTRVRETPTELRNIWARTTEVEALVATGDMDGARKAAEELAASRGADNFELNSLRRQLIEVWGLDPTDPVILAIVDRALQLGTKAAVDLPESPMQLEKILGTALPIGYNNLLKGLRAAESVCKITDSASEPWGTGFLIDGGVVHETLEGEPILVTNAHVICSIPGEGQLRAAEAEAHFEVTKGVDGELLVLTGLTEVWTSPVRRRDVTLLRFETPLPELVQPIQAAPVLPPLTEGAFVYVIGHPAGGGVKFSIRGNDLLAYDAESTKVHYTAPTEGGSSGSPVFTSAWQLMAVHHAGNANMRRFDDPDQTYKANEGITLESIRTEYAATKDSEALA